MFIKFLNDDSGATAVEYGLIAAMIAVTIVAGAGLLGDSINNFFLETSGELDES
ncbi:Flp family type IVb pilin [Litorimonas haliclonae]|uniref:Flp family type IVb pilin n=1 Tax=Litorimonas haliclonae TaxID=2081977 RepID=UPI0039EF8EE4